MRKGIRASGTEEIKKRFNSVHGNVRNGDLQWYMMDKLEHINDKLDNKVDLISCNDIRTTCRANQSSLKSNIFSIITLFVALCACGAAWVAALS